MNSEDNIVEITQLLLARQFAEPHATINMRYLRSKYESRDILLRSSAMYILKHANVLLFTLMVTV